MPRRPVAGLIVALVLMTVSIYTASASQTASQDVQIVIADVGSFSVMLAAADGSGPTFGTVDLDAVTDQTTVGDFNLEYTDTFTQRSEGDVTLSFGSFEPEEVPSFLGSGQAQFEIPNRYLTLVDVGNVTPSPNTPDCGGPITAVTSDEGQSFDNGQSLTVAEVAEGCGVRSAVQPIKLSLNVPAGVYPTNYSATVTIETTVEANGT